MTTPSAAEESETVLPQRQWKTQTNLCFSPDAASMGGHAALDDTDNWLVGQKHRVQFIATPMQSAPGKYVVNAKAGYGRRNENGTPWGRTETPIMDNENELYVVQHLLTYEQEARFTACYQTHGGVVDYSSDLLDAVNPTLPSWNWSFFYKDEDDSEEAVKERAEYVAPRREEIESLPLPQILVTNKVMILAAIDNQGYNVPLADVEMQKENVERIRRDEERKKRKPGAKISKKKAKQDEEDLLYDETKVPEDFKKPLMIGVDGGLAALKPEDEESDVDGDIDDDGDLDSILKKNRPLETPEEKAKRQEEAIEAVEKEFGIELDVVPEDDGVPPPFKQDPDILYRGLDEMATELLESNLENLENPLWFVATYEPIVWTAESLAQAERRAAVDAEHKEHIEFMIANNLEEPRWMIRAFEWSGVYDVTNSKSLEETLQILENLEENFITPRINEDSTHLFVQNMFSMNYRRWIPIAAEMDDIHGDGTLTPRLEM